MRVTAGYNFHQAPYDSDKQAVSAALWVPGAAPAARRPRRRQSREDTRAVWSGSALPGSKSRSVPSGIWSRFRLTGRYHGPSLPVPGSKCPGSPPPDLIRWTRQSPTRSRDGRIKSGHDEVGVMIPVSLKRLYDRAANSSCVSPSARRSVLARGTRFMRANSASVSGGASGDPFDRERITAGDSCRFEAHLVVGQPGCRPAGGMRYAPPPPAGSPRAAGGLLSPIMAGRRWSDWVSRRRASLNVPMHPSPTRPSARRAGNTAEKSRIGNRSRGETRRIGGP